MAEPVPTSESGHEAFLNSFPPGYRFVPTDEELVTCYLRRKVQSKEMPINRIHDVRLYEHSPQELSQFTPFEENNWHFFTPRERKYPKGSRPDRDAKDGYWRATGKDKEIKENGITIGSKRNMVYHFVEEQSQSQPQSNGKRKKRNHVGKPTNWIMHEYILKGNDLPIGTGDNGMLLDTWVLCRLHEKKDKKKDDEPRDATSGDEAGDERTQKRNKMGDSDAEPSNQQVSDHYFNNPSTTQAVAIDNSIEHNNLADQCLDQQRFHPNEAFGQGYVACHTLDQNPNRMSSASTTSGPFPGYDPSPPTNGMTPCSNSSAFQLDRSGVCSVGSGDSYFNDTVDQGGDVLEWWESHLAPAAFTSPPRFDPGSSMSTPAPLAFGNHQALMPSSFPQDPPPHSSYTGSGTDDWIDYSHGSEFDRSN